MGSKTTPNRNRKDSIIIREPIGLNGSGNLSPLDQIADVCEISFDVRLRESPLVKKNVPVSLVRSGLVYHITVLASVVGKLSTKQSEMMDICARLGVRYVGKIIEESNGMYARFTRIVQ